MKKILIWGMTNIAGGVESVVMNFLRNMDRSELEIHFLTYHSNIVYADEITMMGGKILTITPKRESFYKFRKELKEIFINNNYDCVWANNCSLANIDILKYAKKYGVKKRIIHAHNSKNMGSIIHYVLHLINKLSIGKVATHYWSCSKAASEYFYTKKIMGNPNYKIINNAINTNKFRFSEKDRIKLREELGINKNDFVVGHVGRFHEQKNHGFLIDVFNELQKQKKNSKLVLVGIGEGQDAIKQKVKALNIEDKVLFLGARSDIPNLLSAMDIFLFPSLYEGLSVALVEAQTSGLTIFTTTNVISDTKLTENYFSLDLNSGAKYWSEFILKNYNSEWKREKNLEEVTNRNFDIKAEANKMLEQFLLD